MNKIFRVLIVDDNEDWVEYCEKELDIKNVVIDVSCSVDNALERIGRYLYDIIFCDYRMKYEDARGVVHSDGGFLVCGRAKSHLPQVKIIIVTAYGSSELARESLVNLKFDDYMEKDTDPRNDVKNIRSTISQLIDKWGKESIAPNPFYAASGQMPKHMVMRLDGQSQEMKYFANQLVFAEKGKQSRFLVSGLAGSGKTCLLKNYKSFAQKHGHFTSYLEMPRHPVADSLNDAVANLLLSIVSGFPEVGFADFKSLVQCIKDMGIDLKIVGLKMSFDWKKLNTSPHIFLMQGLENLVKDLMSKTSVIVVLIDDIQNLAMAPQTLDCLLQAMNSEKLANKPLVFGASIGRKESFIQFENIEIDKQLTRFFSSRIFHLPNFTLEQLREAVFQALAETGVSFDDSIINLVYKYAAGHPYATQVLLNHLYRDQIGGIVGNDSFEKALRNSMLELYPLFRDLYGDQPLENQKILRCIANAENGLTLKDLRNLLLDENLTELAGIARKNCIELSKKQVIRTDDAGNYHIMNLIYREYLLDS